MYYLHAKKDGNITENVFNNLDIQGQDRDTLNALISKSEKFTPEDLQSIQGIIAPKARALAAKATKDSFLADFRASSLFPSVAYGLKHSFQQALGDEGTCLQNNFDNNDYIKAGIYGFQDVNNGRVQDVKKSMDEFAITKVDEIRDMLNGKEWGEHLLAKKCEKRHELTDEEVKNIRKLFLEKIIEDKTREFLLSDNLLKRYCDKIGKVGSWGTEEDLMNLHRVVQGERMVRDVNQKVKVVHDVEIKLGVQRQDQNFYEGEPLMVLCNEGSGDGSHWTSSIDREQVNYVAEHVAIVPASVNVESLSPPLTPRGADIIEINIGRVADKFKEQYRKELNMLILKYLNDHSEVSSPDESSKKDLDAMKGRTIEQAAEIGETKTQQDLDAEFAKDLQTAEIEEAFINTTKPR